MPCPLCADVDTEVFAQARDVEYRTSSALYTYCRCLRCAAIFLASPPVQRLREIYPPSYYSLHSFRSGGEDSLALRIKEHLDARLFRRILRDLPGEQLAVLDVGGGTGWLLSVIRNTDRRVVLTYEVDLDESARPAAETAGHIFHCTPVESFQAEQRFDFILLLNILEHVADPGAVLERMARLLTANGRILIKTPNTDTLDARLFRNHNWGGFHTPRHWVLFNESNLRALAQRCGLDCAWVRYTQGAPQWTSSLLGLLAERGCIDVSVQRPMYRHPLHAPLLALTAAVDFLRLPFAKTAQMFVLLKSRSGV